jgi:hypothetical protein
MNPTQITAYQCVCGIAYLTEKHAIECCPPERDLCSCGAKIDKTQWRCTQCKDREDGLRWESAESRPATSDELLYSEQADKYISYDIQEFLDELEIEKEEYQELLTLPHIEIARKFRIYICKPKSPEPFNLSEEYEEYCFEDHELPGDWESVEKAIEDWINSVPVNEWSQYPTRVAWNGQCVSGDKEATGTNA